MEKRSFTLPDRAPYSAIVDRPRLRLPNGERMAVWTIVNAEHWASDRAMPRAVLPPPMGRPLIPDIPNWSWHEYGMRVGIWRFMQVLGQRGIIPTFAVNGSVCTAYPRIVEEAHRMGWEFMGHGYIQGPMHSVENQQEAIGETMAAIKSVTGRSPKGWESPGLTETDSTLDWLREAGIEYVADWVLDDQPTRLRTHHGDMISLPYSVEINDVVISAVQTQPSDEIARRGIAQFDRLYQESSESTRVMAISIHPYLTGVPHRIGALEALYDHILAHDDVAMMTGEAICDWYKTQTVTDRDDSR